MQTRNRWLILAIASSALLLITIDMTVLYTALPTLTHDLNASATEKLWIVNAYALVVAGLLPGFGALGDRFGPKAMLLFGLLVFGIASLIAAFAPSPLVLVAARVLLAVGAASMMPATLSIIRHVFDDEQERSIAIGIWASVSAGGAAFGPVLGGLLLEYFWWGSVFLINVPIVVIAFFAGLILIPKPETSRAHPLDIWGSLQIMIGLVGVVFAVKELARRDPSWPLAIATLTIGSVFILIFVRRQFRSRAPMIDFSLFRSASFTSAVVVAIISLAALVGLELVLSQRLQLVVGLSPLEAGIFILPIPVAAFFAGPMVGAIMPRVGARHILWSGLLLAGLGMALHLATYSAGTTMQIISFVMLGFGIGSAMTGASSAIMLNAPVEQSGMAASIEEVSFELGSALGVAILGSVMNAAYTHFVTVPAELDTPANIRDSLDQALIAAQTMDAGSASRLVELARHAFNQSFEVVLSVAVTMLIATAIGVLLFGRAQAPDAPDRHAR